MPHPARKMAAERLHGILCRLGSEQLHEIRQCHDVVERAIQGAAEFCGGSDASRLLSPVAQFQQRIELTCEWGERFPQGNEHTLVPSGMVRPEQGYGFKRT